ncbi:MAG: FtsW/RodA/SpoVE family cell cycle protein, partial [Lachnospiraceae bacterium]|nr:FtsW/RodA/SpoVE family cell cycle protein [Lachnospiraceae bacterium]
MLVLVLLLVIFGLVLLYSTSAYNGRVKFHDEAYYFKKQLFATSLGLMAMYLVSQMDYHWLVKMAPLCYLISMGLSTLVLFVGEEYNGSKRWLSLGPLSFQPSEFAKVAVILFLAYQIERTKKTTGFLFMLKVMLWILPIVGLVGANNLSTAIIILGIAVILIFMSNPKYLQFIGVGVAGIAFVGIFLAMESYRLERLAIWRNPEKYEKGFQTIQGLYAIG